MQLRNGRVLSFLGRSWRAACLFVVLGVVAPGSIHAHGQVKGTAVGSTVFTLPSTPAANQFGEWLRAFNAGDRAQMGSFVNKHFADAALTRISVEERVAMDAVIYKSTHGLVPFQVDWSTDPEITVLTRSNLTEELVRVHLEVGSDPQHRINKLTYTLTGRPADPGSLHNLSQNDMLKRLDTYVAQLSAADLFSGSVAVARNGKAIFEKAFGEADKASKSPNHPDTKFNLASMSKMFTAIAVAQLVAQGKLSFQDVVGKYLPDYPNKQVAQEVTIDELLTHTAGMGDYFNLRFGGAKNDLRSVSDYLPLFEKDRLPLRPGAKYHYSNAGYIVLGAIIEKVSGEDYFDYVKKHIYAPAGMTDSDAYELDQPAAGRATGYTNLVPNGRPELVDRADNTAMLPVKGGPAGGSYSTVEDLLKFANALQNHKLLDEASTRSLMSGKVDRDDEAGGKYAYGFAEDLLNEKRIVGYSGSFAGASGVFDMYPDLGYTVVVLSNYDAPAAQRIALQLREMITTPAAR